MLAWHRGTGPADVFLSTLVVGEIRQGIERIRARDAGQAEALERWLAGLVASYGERILPVSADVAQDLGPAQRRRPNHRRWSTG